MSANNNNKRETEHRLTALEIRTKENCQDIGELKGNMKDLRVELKESEARVTDRIVETEGRLNDEIKDNRSTIIRILKNDLPHIVEDMQKPTGPTRWDIVKLVGAVAGILSGVTIIFTNLGTIGEALYSFLKFFFG